MKWIEVEMSVRKIKLILLFLVIYHGFDLLIKFLGIDLSGVHLWKRVLVGVATIACHESIHFLIGFFVAVNRGKTHFGCIPKRLIVYCIVDGEYSYMSFVKYIMGPFVILTLLLMSALWAFKFDSDILWLVAFYNAFLSSMDLYNFLSVIRHYDGKGMFKVDKFLLYRSVYFISQEKG